MSIRALSTPLGASSLQKDMAPTSKVASDVNQTGGGDSMEEDSDSEPEVSQRMYFSLQTLGKDRVLSYKALLQEAGLLSNDDLSVASNKSPSHNKAVEADDSKEAGGDGSGDDDGDGSDSQNDDEGDSTGVVSTPATPTGATSSEVNGKVVKRRRKRTQQYDLEDDFVDDSELMDLSEFKEETEVEGFFACSGSAATKKKKSTKGAKPLDTEELLKVELPSTLTASLKKLEEYVTTNPLSKNLTRVPKVVNPYLLEIEKAYQAAGLNKVQSSALYVQVGGIIQFSNTSSRQKMRKLYNVYLTDYLEKHVETLMNKLKGRVRIAKKASTLPLKIEQFEELLYDICFKHQELMEARNFGKRKADKEEWKEAREPIFKELQQLFPKSAKVDVDDVRNLYFKVDSAKAAMRDENSEQKVEPPSPLVDEDDDVAEKRTRKRKVPTIVVEETVPATVPAAAAESNKMDVEIVEKLPSDASNDNGKPEAVAKEVKVKRASSRRKASDKGSVKEGAPKKGKKKQKTEKGTVETPKVKTVKKKKSVVPTPEPEKPSPEPEKGEPLRGSNFGILPDNPWSTQYFLNA